MPKLCIALMMAAIVANAAVPKIISKVEPEYTAEAEEAHVSGAVVVSFSISPSGIPENLKVKRGCGFGLDEKALEAVNRWRFQPVMPAEPISTSIELNFRYLEKGHQGQTSCLQFQLPPGSTRPSLIQGQIPPNPPHSVGESARIQFRIDEKGNVRDIFVLETTNQSFSDIVVHQIRDWQFKPATFEGQFVGVQATFDFAREPARRPAE